MRGLANEEAKISVTSRGNDSRRPPRTQCSKRYLGRTPANRCCKRGHILQAATSLLAININGGTPQCDYVKLRNAHLSVSPQIDLRISTWNL